MENFQVWRLPEKRCTSAGLCADARPPICMARMSGRFFAFISLQGQLFSRGGFLEQHRSRVRLSSSGYPLVGVPFSDTFF